MGILDAPSLSRAALNAIYASAGARPAELVAAKGAGAWEPSRSLYNWSAPTMAKLRARIAYANGGFGSLLIMCAGDSTTAGQGSGVGTAYPRQLAKRLLDVGLPGGGPGITFLNQGPKDVLTDPRLTMVNFHQQGGGYNLFRESTVAGASIDFTDPGVTSTIARIGYMGRSAPFRYQIDGGAWTTVTPPGTDTREEVTVTGLPDAVHAIRVESTTAAATWIKSVGLQKTGVQVVNAGYYGSRSADWVGTTSSEALGDTLFFYPDVVIFNIGINDSVNNVPVATFKANVNSTINTMKVHPTPPAIILTTSNPINTQYYNTLPAYTQALYEIADTQGLPLVDFFDRTGGWAAMSANGLKDDDLHPNTAWYIDKGRALAEILVR